jgi:hypothetical protein
VLGGADRGGATQDQLILSLTDNLGDDRCGYADRQDSEAGPGFEVMMR